MRFRITEPTFFLHKERKVGEIMEAPVGPYRNFATSGGLQRIPQFVEMPDEIKEIIQDAAAAPAPPVEAVLPMPSPLPVADPAAAAPKRPIAKPNPLAARVRALTARRAKFQDFAAGLLDTGEKHMTEMEQQGPLILTRAVESAKDEIDAIVDLDDAMKQFAASNGGDPLPE
jgi:hypothetical protein